MESKKYYMKNTDVLIIGGSAAGMVAAITGKSSWNEKSFMLVKKSSKKKYKPALSKSKDNFMKYCTGLI